MGGHDTRGPRTCSARRKGRRSRPTGSPPPASAAPRCPSAPSPAAAPAAPRFSRRPSCGCLPFARSPALTALTASGACCLPARRKPPSAPALPPQQRAPNRLPAGGLPLAQGGALPATCRYALACPTNALAASHSRLTTHLARSACLSWQRSRAPPERPRPPVAWPACQVSASQHPVSSPAASETLQSCAAPHGYAGRRRGSACQRPLPSCLAGGVPQQRTLARSPRCAQPASAATRWYPAPSCCCKRAVHRRTPR
jgi:hypothetical protein